MKGRTGTTLIAAATIAIGSVAVTASGIGFAVAASHSSTIHGCVSKANGQLRIVSGSKHCTSRERSISWNSRGPRGRTGAPGTSGTFQMYANVDQNGNLGSNYDADSVVIHNPESASGVSYTVTFAKPIGACAGVAQPGFAGGNLDAEPVTPLVEASSSNAFDVQFHAGNGTEHSAFMITVTCHN
jgi:hypothetical protein